MTTKRKRRKPPRPANEWYELVAHFDADKIKAVPVEGRAFLMGKINQIHVVEVARATPQEQLGKLASWLEENGIEAIVVSEGVRFMKLKPVTDAEYDMLEAHLRGDFDEPSDTDADVAHSAGA